MSMCPVCGLPPTVTEVDDDTEQPWYMCENDHTWEETPGT
jgi:hypothetical protein